MSFPLSAVSSVTPTTPTAYVHTERAEPTGSTAMATFSEALSGSVESLQNMQHTSRQLAVDAVTGDLEDLHAATIASSRSSIALETITTFRNRGVEAFNEIMRMQA